MVFLWLDHSILTVGRKQNLSEPALVLRKVSAEEVLLAGEIRQNMT